SFNRRPNKFKPRHRAGFSISKSANRYFLRYVQRNTTIEPFRSASLGIISMTFFCDAIVNMAFDNALDTENTGWGYTRFAETTA
ncbi:hypothetical protein ACUILU_004620, partial [Salmonella enterica subsp. enterica serovar Brandenburg]